MENIFTSEWNSPGTYPVINANGDILGCIGSDEKPSDYLPVMVDRVLRRYYTEMTLTPDAFISEDDYKE